MIHTKSDYLASDVFIWLESGQLSLIFHASPGSATTGLGGRLPYGTGNWHIHRLAESLTCGYTLWSVATRGSWRSTRLLVHSPLEILPPVLSNRLVGSWHLLGRLLEDVKKHEKALRAPVEDPKEPAPVVAAKLPQLAFHLATVRKRQRRIDITEVIQAVDLQVERGLNARRQVIDEVIDRLNPVSVAVVNGVHFRHVCKHGRQRLDY